MIKALVSGLVAVAGGTALWEVWRSRRSAVPPADAYTPAILQGGKPLFSFFLLSDIHLSTSNGDMEEKLRLALNDITHFELPVEALVLGGDLVDGGRDEEYQLLRKIFGEFKLPPMYGNMGNHEYYGIWYDAKGEWSKDTVPNGQTDAGARERFMRFMGLDRPYSDAWVGGVHLIMVSQEAYVQERPEVSEGAWYSDEQLAWLKETLKPHADGKPAFVFIHQPLPPDGQDGGAHRVIRNKEFREILRPYRNVFVLSGHTHRNFNTDGHYVRDTTFHWITNASVGRTRAAEGSWNPAQGLYVQVHANRVVLVGREFSNRSWIKAAEWSLPIET